MNINGSAKRGGSDRSAQVADDLARALAAARTRRVAGWDEVPGALADLGLRPRAGWCGPALLSQVRDAEEGRYALVYNPSACEAVSLVLDVEGEGAAAVVDLDAGAVRPVAARAAEGRTCVDLALAPLGLAVVRVGEPVGKPPAHPVRAPRGPSRGRNSPHTAAPRSLPPHQPHGSQA